MQARRTAYVADTYPESACLKLGRVAARRGIQRGDLVRGLSPNPLQNSQAAIQLPLGTDRW